VSFYAVPFVTWARDRDDHLGSESAQRSAEKLLLYQLFLLSSRALSSWLAFVGGRCADTRLRIFQIPKLGTKLKQDALPLSYTPRKLVPHPTNRFFYLVESDHRAYPDEDTKQKAVELVRLLAHAPPR
jgi:hypothetical protein